VSAKWMFSMCVQSILSLSAIGCSPKELLRKAGKSLESVIIVRRDRFFEPVGDQMLCMCVHTLTWGPHGPYVKSYNAD